MRGGGGDSNIEGEAEDVGLNSVEGGADIPGLNSVDGEDDVFSPLNDPKSRSPSLSIKLDCGSVAGEAGAPTT